jgi:hypothetical protein
VIKDELSVTEPRWLKTLPITFPAGPDWLEGGTWYRGSVIKQPVSPPGVFLDSPDGTETIRLMGTSIDWNAGHEGPA